MSSFFLQFCYPYNDCLLEQFLILSRYLHTSVNILVSFILTPPEYFAYQVSQAISKNYLEISRAATLKEAMKSMNDRHLNCAFVVDADDLLVGILTCGDIRRFLSRNSSFGAKDPTLPDVCQ